MRLTKGQLTAHFASNMQNDNKLLNLIRERRKYEYRTLDRYKPLDPLMHKLLTDEIVMEMEELSRQNKRKIRKEIKRRKAEGDPTLEALLKRKKIVDKGPGSIF